MPPRIPKSRSAKLADSIERFDIVNPIIISSDHEVIAGHGRVAAAKLLEIDFLTPSANDFCNTICQQRKW